MSLFKGTPQTAPSYVSSTTETPKWMQDAIYNQINWSQNIANMPYEAYTGQLVATPQAQQQSAWEKVSKMQGAYETPMLDAMRNTQAIAAAPGAETAAAPYFQRALAADPFMAAQGALSAQAGMLNQMDYAAPARNLSPYIQEAAAGTIGAAAPATARVAEYLNPFTEAVTNRIAQLGARNLQENLAPALGAQFIRAGQFGSRGMGEMGARTLRDLNESVMAQQAQALQQGYGQALSAAQTDAGRQLQAAQQLASVGGQLTQAQQQAVAQAMAGAGQYGQMAQTAGGLAGQQQQAMLSAAQQSGAMRTADLQRQQSALNQLAQQAQQQVRLAVGQAEQRRHLAADSGNGQAERQQQRAEHDDGIDDPFDQFGRPGAQVAAVADVGGRLVGDAAGAGRHGQRQHQHDDAPGRRLAGRRAAEQRAQLALQAAQGDAEHQQQRAAGHADPDHLGRDVVHRAHTVRLSRRPSRSASDRPAPAA